MPRAGAEVIESGEATVLLGWVPGQLKVSIAAVAAVPKPPFRALAGAHVSADILKRRTVENLADRFRCRVETIKEAITRSGSSLHQRPKWPVGFHPVVERCVTSQSVDELVLATVPAAVRMVWGEQAGYHVEEALKTYKVKRARPQTAGTKRKCHASEAEGAEEVGNSVALVEVESETSAVSPTSPLHAAVGSSSGTYRSGIASQEASVWSNHEMYHKSGAVSMDVFGECDPTLGRPLIPDAPAVGHSLPASRLSLDHPQMRPHPVSPIGPSWAPAAKPYLTPALQGCAQLCGGSGEGIGSAAYACDQQPDSVPQPATQFGTAICLWVAAETSRPMPGLDHHRLAFPPSDVPRVLGAHPIGPCDQHPQLQFARGCGAGPLAAARQDTRASFNELLTGQPVVGFSDVGSIGCAPSAVTPPDVSSHFTTVMSSYPQPYHQGGSLSTNGFGAGHQTSWCTVSRDPFGVVHPLPGSSSSSEPQQASPGAYCHSSPMGSRFVCHTAEMSAPTPPHGERPQERPWRDDLLSNAAPPSQANGYPDLRPDPSAAPRAAYRPSHLGPEPVAPYVAGQCHLPPAPPYSHSARPFHQDHGPTRTAAPQKEHSSCTLPLVSWVADKSSRPWELSTAALPLQSQSQRLPPPASNRAVGTCGYGHEPSWDSTAIRKLPPASEVAPLNAAAERHFEEETEGGSSTHTGGSESDRSNCRSLLKRSHPEMDSAAAARNKQVSYIVRRCKVTGKSPLAEETGRGSGKPDYPIGAVIITRRNEDGETVEFGAPKMVGMELLCHQVRRGTATLQCETAKSCFMRGAHTAYCWALLVERKVKAAMAKAGQLRRQRSQRVRLPVGASLRSRDHNIDLFFTRMEQGLQGDSCGVLTALCFLQLLTECSFHEKSVITGGITFRGKVTKVDGADIKYKGVRQWCGRYVYPIENQWEMDPIIMEIGEGTQTERLFRPVSTMGDVVEVMVTDAGLSKKECVGFSTDVAATYLACQVEMNGRLQLLQIEACVVPGSGQLRLMGDVPDVVRVEARRAFNWVVKNAENIMTVVKDKAPHAELLIDWSSQRYTPQHPYADEMREHAEDILGDGEDEIRKNSLDLCFNLGYEAERMAQPVYGVAMVLLMVSLMSGVPLPENKVAANYSFWPQTNWLGPCMEPTLELIDGLRASGVRWLALPAGVREGQYPGDHPLIVAAGNLLPQKLPRTIWDVIRLAF